MVRKLYFFMLSLAIGLLACSESTNKESKQQGDNSITNRKEQLMHQLASLKSEHASCNLFLETYDAYLEEYVSVTQKMLESSADTALLQQLNNLQQKRNDLIHPTECGQDRLFVEKYQLINKKFLKS